MRTNQNNEVWKNYDNWILKGPYDDEVTKEDPTPPAVDRAYNFVDDNQGKTDDKINEAVEIINELLELI